MFAYDPYTLLDPVPEFTVESDDIADGSPLPRAQYGADAGGEDRSPNLRWSGFPEGTKSFAVTCFDPDAPTGSGFWHWAVANIPAEVTELQTGAGAPGSSALPPSALTLPNELRLAQFVGAGPPEGTGVHRYIFVVHAVDVPHLDLDPQSTPAVLGFNLHFHTLGRAILAATGAFGAV
ncbi:YbhB/YbcL family Raf kinase inhibitor-like protein [Plantibacter sp. YIM 135249]|jgi:Raf kinase inhibitor-like YbhB/YbcL family protein|uniref:YbhB/YbcL family Raf kinase inhibitor-like protein n=1 Tax=Plantibacter sp. YIM 135249 TaxID=3423918 RepID=UPI003D338F9B